MVVIKYPSQARGLTGHRGNWDGGSVAPPGGHRSTGL